MWFWGTVILVIAVVGLVVIVVDRRRGPSAEPGRLDFNETNRTGTGYQGDVNGPISGGSGGGGGG